jgi:hypothetical protein
MPAIEPNADAEPTTAPTSSPSPRSTPDPATEAVSTGFPALDALLGTGGLPRRASATLRGDASSGKTTLALRSVAEAQAAGGIVAWLDGGRTFDPLEAAARGVDLRWLVVLRPAEVGEGLRLAGALVSGRAVDLLVLDLPPRLAPPSRAPCAGSRPTPTDRRPARPRAADLAAPIHGALAEAAGVRLELERSAGSARPHIVGQHGGDDQEPLRCPAGRPSWRSATSTMGSARWREPTHDASADLDDRPAATATRPGSPARPSRSPRPRSDHRPRLPIVWPNLLLRLELTRLGLPWTPTAPLVLGGRPWTRVVLDRSPAAARFGVRPGQPLGSPTGRP